MNISVIIPVYRNSDLFLKNLKNNIKFLSNCEIIVVNDYIGESLKDKLKDYQDIILIENNKNKGFGNTINIGVNKAKHKYILLLNSDVVLTNEDYKNAIHYFENNTDLFAVSFSQKEKDGSIVGRNTIYWQKGMMNHKKANNISFGNNAWAEGGSCIIDKHKFNNLNGFDPIYSPFYWEDIDLSYRALKTGYKILFDPSIQVIHYHESTIGKYFDKKYIKTIGLRNQLIFIWKNIFDTNLVLKHIFFLPYYFIYFLIKLDFSFLNAFFQAISKLDITCKKRKEQKKSIKLTDMEILLKFKK